MAHNSQFAKDVHEGLSHTPKHLSSKYFYDAAGDQLFQQIMQLPEYYLTRAEANIFNTQAKEIIHNFSIDHRIFDLLELGAGDGEKTIHLLAALKEMAYDFTYIPLDISGNVLSILKSKIASTLPSVAVQPVEGDYFESLKKLKKSTRPKIILFLGSSLGNMMDDLAASFIKSVSEEMNTGDKFLLGVDLIKAQEIVLPAYNDSKGITKAFNLNLLQRINTELGGDFNINAFTHIPEYTQEEGIARSSLRSNTSQTVTINQTGNSYSFAVGEKIHTEISRKYNDNIIATIIAGNGLQVKAKFMDEQNYFADYLMEKT